MKLDKKETAEEGTVKVLQNQKSIQFHRLVIVVTMCLACATIHAAEELIINGDFESEDFTGDGQTTTFSNWTVTAGFARGDENDSGRVPGTNPNQVVRMGANNEGVESMYQDIIHNWGSSETYTLSLNAVTVYWKAGGELVVNLLQQDDTVLWTSGAISAPEHPDSAVAAWTPEMTFTYEIDASTFSAGTEGSALRLEISRSANILWLDNVSLVLNDGDPLVDLSNQVVASNSVPGTLVGNLNVANTNGVFTYAMETGAGDDAYFEIPTGTTNLRTTAWMDSSSYTISIIGTEQGGGGLVVTNDFTITVDAASVEDLVFVVSAEVQHGADDGVVVGRAETVRSSPVFSVSGGRMDLFYFDGAELKVTNSADWGSVGTTNYVTLKAVSGSLTNELVVAASVGSSTTSGTVFRFL